LFTEGLVHVLGGGERMVVSGKSLDQGAYGYRKFYSSQVHKAPSFSIEISGLYMSTSTHINNQAIGPSMPCWEHK
jgi:uncharacterized protein YodC (DUF2158 family)